MKPKMLSCSAWRKGGGCGEFKGHAPVWGTSCTAFWERTKQMVVQPSTTSLRRHYFPPAQKRWGHPFVFAWLKYKGVPCLNPSCPPSWGHTTSGVRERGGGREKRAGSGHSDYGFQFWQLKATQGLLCAGTCNKGQNIQKAKALSVMLCKPALAQVWHLLQCSQNNKKGNIIIIFHLKSVLNW